MSQQFSQQDFFLWNNHTQIQTFYLMNNLVLKDIWTILIDYGKSCYWRIVRRSSHWFHFGKSGVFSNHLRRALKKYLFDEITPKFNENAVLLWVKLSIMKKSLNWMKYMYKFYLFKTFIYQNMPFSCRTSLLLFFFS